MKKVLLLFLLMSVVTSFCKTINGEIKKDAQINTNKIYDSSNRAFPPEIEIVNGSSTSPDIYINSHDILEEEGL